MSQSASKISPELKESLDDASSAFEVKSYKTAARYYNNSLNLWMKDNNKRQSQIFILIKYMICICLLRSKDAKDLLDSLKNLEDLMKSTNQRHEYPMFYYALGKANYKLYRFDNADDMVKKGFSAINRDTNVIEYMRPGTSIVITESKKEGLMAKLVKLKNQCSGWHRPDASCCLIDCSLHCYNEGVDKNIFFGSPTFHGMVQVTCNNPFNFCTIHFHLACWKIQKEQLSSIKKLSDKDVLNYDCFTPNCENQGVRCVIKKIDIYDENAKLKATVESRNDDLTWHGKVNQPVKGAIKKQPQMIKLKLTPNNNRGIADERQPPRSLPVSNDVAMTNSTFHRVKIEETEEDDDLPEEHALKESIEKLVELRSRNFDIPMNEMWRPDSQMYGNDFMLSTAEQIPDPDFGDADVAITKAFIFSYFHSYVSENSPVKLVDLLSKWEEAKTLTDNSECVLDNHKDIIEFLVQSLKFSIVGEYICVAGKLPEAYQSTKDDVCAVIKFFIDSDASRRSSNDPPIDDEALTELLNEEKNNNENISALYYLDSVDDKSSSVISETAIENVEKITSNESAQATKIYFPTNETAEYVTLEEFVERIEINGIAMLEDKKIIKDVKSVESEIFSQIETSKFHSPIVRQIEECDQTLKYPETDETNRSNSLISAKENLNNNSPCNSTNEYTICENGNNRISQETNDNINFTEIFKSTNDFFNDANESTNADTSTLMNYHYGSKSIAPNDVNEVSNNGNSPNNPFVAGSLINEISNSKGDLAMAPEHTTDLVSESSRNGQTTSMAMKTRIIQNTLIEQFTSTQSLLRSKIEECQRNLEVIADIQSFLMSATGRRLPYNGEDWSTTLMQLEKISKHQEIKYWQLKNALLSEKTEEHELVNVDLSDIVIPDMPNRKLIDVIRWACEIYSSMTRHLPYISVPDMTIPPPLFYAHPPPPFNHHLNAYGLLPYHRNNQIVNHQFPMNGQNIKIFEQHSLKPNDRSSSNSVSSRRNNQIVNHQIPMNAQNIPIFGRHSLKPNDQSSSNSVSSRQNNRSINRPINNYDMRSSSSLPQNDDAASQRATNSVPEFSNNRNNSINQTNLIDQNTSTNNQNLKSSSITKSVQELQKLQESLDQQETASMDINIMNGIEKIIYSDDDDTKIVKDEESAANSLGDDNKVEKICKNNGKSVDKLMRKMKNIHRNVFELDLIKAIESVRKNHNNSLTGMSIGQIIDEAAYIVIERQRKHLCSYDVLLNPSNGCAAPNSSAPGSSRSTENDFAVSTSFANSSKNDSQRSSKLTKTWKHIEKPNVTWNRDETETSCCICFESLIDQHFGTCCTLPCKHIFHVQCIEKWSSTNPTCPECRAYCLNDSIYPALGV